MVSTRNGASGVNARLKIQFIIAAENRDAIQGEFFEELDVILNQGKTSVILEAWYLDEINEGAVKPILKQCGVDAYNYFGSSRSPQELIIYPLVRDHPILNEPVPITDYKIADYWPCEDLGDLMYLNGLGDAQFILGRKDRNPEEEGVLTTCMNNRLLLLTLSTHNYMDETLVPLWMNMIDFALETHFGG